MGAAWRSRTLFCLQSVLVYLLTMSPIPTCDQIRKAAFDSHPGCYTKSPNSICDLPLSDLQIIFATISTKQSITWNTVNQMVSVIVTCTKALIIRGAKIILNEIPSDLRLQEIIKGIKTIIVQKSNILQEELFIPNNIIQHTRTAANSTLELHLWEPTSTSNSEQADKDIRLIQTILLDQTVRSNLNITNVIIE